MIRVNQHRDSILALKSQGMSQRRIASELGISPGSVAGVLVRAKNGQSPKERWPDNSPEALRRDAVIAARIEGQTPKQIASRMALTIGVVNGILTRAKSEGKLANAKAVPMFGKPKPETKSVAYREPLRNAGERIAPRPIPQEIPMSALQSLEQVQATGGCRFAPSDPRLGFCGQPRQTADIPFPLDPAPYCPTHRERCVSRSGRSGD